MADDGTGTHSLTDTFLHHLPAKATDFGLNLLDTCCLEEQLSTR